MMQIHTGTSSKATKYYQLMSLYSVVIEELGKTSIIFNLLEFQLSKDPKIRRIRHNFRVRLSLNCATFKIL